MEFVVYMFFLYNVSLPFKKYNNRGTMFRMILHNNDVPQFWNTIHQYILSRLHVNSIVNIHVNRSALFRVDHPHGSSKTINSKSSTTYSIVAGCMSGLFEDNAYAVKQY